MDLSTWIQSAFQDLTQKKENQTSFRNVRQLLITHLPNDLSAFIQRVSGTVKWRRPEACL